MEIQLNLNGRKRKEAVVCIGDAINTMPVYQKSPTYAYDIGGLTLDRDGVLHIGDSDEALPKVLSALYDAGFCQPEPESETVAPAPDPQCPAIQIPLSDFTPVALDNLDKLVASKATLIRKAIDAESLPIEKGSETLNFLWLKEDATAEQVTAYTQLAEKLCDMARKQSRILATEKPVDNEKYAFRCFLLRLGFIGEEYAVTRRILLQNLSGNGSRRSAEALPRNRSTATVEQTNDGEANSTALIPDNGIVVIAPSAGKPRFSFKKLFHALKDMALN